MGALMNDPISGGAGWVGAGLLGLVLGWFLLVRLPAQDRERSSMLDSRDRLIGNVSEGHRVVLKQMVEDHRVSFQRMEDDHRKAFIDAEIQRRKDFSEALKVVTDHCAKENDHSREMIRRSLDEFSEAITDLRTGLEELREAYLTNKQHPQRSNKSA